MNKLFVRELISGNEVAVGNWDEAYATRDRLQDMALRAGYDLTEKRFGIRVSQ